MSPPRSPSLRSFLWVALVAVVLLAAAILLLSPKAETTPDQPRLPAGFALKSVAVELPDDDATFPPGPNVETMTTACTACHSPSMITNQPALKPEQWAATVKKMREVYKAPVAEADVPKVLAYLDALSSGRQGTH